MLFTDFASEAAYFENPEVYSMSREPSYSNSSIGPPPMPNGISTPMDNNYNEHESHNTLTVEFGQQKRPSMQSNTSQQSSHTTAESICTQISACKTIWRKAECLSGIFLYIYFYFYKF